MGIFKKKKKEDKSIKAPLVRIEVKRLLGNSVPYTIARFDAIQDKDPDGNLVLINEDANFKDDVEITQNKLIQKLHYTLDLHSLDDTAKKEKVQKRIDEQDRFVKSIKEGYVIKKVKNEQGIEEEKKVKVNKIDEENKLEQYKVFLDTLTNSGEGSYEEIDLDGVKKVSYLLKEGVLYPYKLIKANGNLYPDISVDRKVYKAEQDLIDKEFLNDTKDFFSGFKTYLMIGLLAIIIIANVVWTTKVMSLYNEWDESNIAELVKSSEGSAVLCAKYFATIGEETETFINAHSNIDNKGEKNDNSGSPVKVG